MTALISQNGRGTSASVTANDCRRRSAISAAITSGKSGTEAGSGVGIRTEAVGEMKREGVREIRETGRGAVETREIEMGKRIGERRGRKRREEGVGRMDFGTQNGMQWCWRRGFRRGRKGDATTSTQTKDLRWVKELHA